MKKKALLILVILLIIILGVIIYHMCFTNNESLDNLDSNSTYEDSTNLINEESQIIEEDLNSTDDEDIKNIEDNSKNVVDDDENIKIIEENTKNATDEVLEDKNSNTTQNVIDEIPNNNNQSNNQSKEDQILDDDSNNSKNANSTVEEDNIPTQEVMPWDELGISEYDYYHKPMWSWAKVDYSIDTYGTEENTKNACINDGNKLMEEGFGFSCTSINSYAGTYLGEMLKKF